MNTTDPSATPLMLLPCPFCGFEEPESARCLNCGARGPGDFNAWGLSVESDEIPVDENEAWNRRMPSAAEVKHATNLIHFIDTLGWVVDTLKHHHMTKPGIAAIVQEVDRRMKSENVQGMGRRDGRPPQENG